MRPSPLGALKCEQPALPLCSSSRKLGSTCAAIEALLQLASPREMIALGRKGAEKLSNRSIDPRGRHHTGDTSCTGCEPTDRSPGAASYRGRRAGGRSQRYRHACSSSLLLGGLAQMQPAARGREKVAAAPEIVVADPGAWALGEALGPAFAAKHGQQVRGQRRSGMLTAGLAHMLASALSNTSVAGAQPVCASSAVLAGAAALPFAAFVRGYFSGVFTPSYWRWRWMNGRGPL